MKEKVAQYMADFFAEHGIVDIFTVTGGGAMHMNDAFGHDERLHCTYDHHEQACAIAAEGYTRLTGRLAAVCVTSGPGGTNAMTGVLGGWLDSIPMFIVSGQVKTSTTISASPVPLRQLGDQEFNIVDSVRPMTKYAVMVTEPKTIRYQMEKALYLAENGRGGPVWLDMPLDVQGAVIETTELKGFDPEEEKIYEKPVFSIETAKKIIEKIEMADRPLIFAGTGIRLADAEDDFLKLVEKWKIPVVTAWNAHDVLPTDSPYFCGKPGTVGLRGGNFAVQNCDLLLVLGSRLNIRLISYNYKEFAKDSYKIIVDIDENELHKPTVHADMPVNADVKDVIETLLTLKEPKRDDITERWLSFAVRTDRAYPPVLPEYHHSSELINPYVFLDQFYEHLNDDDVVITGNGSACVMGFQACRIKKGQRLFTNSGAAAMGYGFPASIGAAVSRHGKRVFCLDGDGSFQMNIQELQTVVYNNLNLKIVYLNNNGYHSIRQTQTNLFKPPLVGVCNGNGLSFPDMSRIASAYGIPYYCITEEDGADRILDEALSEKGAVIIEAVVDPGQNFSPKLSSKAMPDGTMVSPEPDDMFPFLPREEYDRIKSEAVSIHRQ